MSWIPATNVTHSLVLDHSQTYHVYPDGNQCACARTILTLCRCHVFRLHGSPCRDCDWGPEDATMIQWQYIVVALPDCNSRVW